MKNWCTTSNLLQLLLKVQIFHVSPWFQNTDMEFTAHVSYLEIYNDSGYDLLDPKHEASKLEDLPWVYYWSLP